MFFLKSEKNEKYVFSNTGYDVHRVREKRGHSILGITLTNLDTASLFLAWIIPILQRTKPLENLAQNGNIVTWRWHHKWRHQNAVCRQRRTFKKSFSKGKNMTLQVNCWKNKRTETGIVADYKSFGKIDKFGSVWQWTSSKSIMLSLFSSVVSRGRPACIKGGVTHCKHWFSVKLTLITFMSTFTTTVDNSTICTNKLIFFGVEFCPFLVLLCNG